MTTIRGRNGTLGPTIRSLRDQRPQPQEIRLYLGPGAAEVDGVTCIHTEDLGPLTKISAVRDPAVPDDALIVTADDDIVYQPGWLQVLISGALQHPHAAVGMAGWNVGGFLADPVRGNYQFKQSGRCDVLEGFAGVAYRKHFFDDELLAVPERFRRNDDVWISAQLRRRDVARIVIARPMVRTGPLAGLHNAPDFVAFTRAAAVELFATKAHPNAPLLTICVPSLTKRKRLLDRLIACLREQPRFCDVELLVDADDGQQTTGTKRNQLVARAKGAYIVHIDDDDLVSPRYLEAVLAAVDQHPGVDVILIRGQRRVTGRHGGSRTYFDYRLHVREGLREQNAVWRTPSHLCPLRADIAKTLVFPEITLGEDLQWSTQLRSRLQTSARAGDPRELLYFYEWDPTKQPTPSARARR